MIMQYILFCPAQHFNRHVCLSCGKRHFGEKERIFFHKSCFRCTVCSRLLNIDEFTFLKGVAGDETGRFYCLEHYMQNLSAPDSPKSHYQVSKNCFFKL